MPRISSLMALTVGLATATAGIASAQAGEGRAAPVVTPPGAAAPIDTLDSVLARAGEARVLITLKTPFDGKTKPLWTEAGKDFTAAWPALQRAGIISLFGNHALGKTTLADRLKIKGARHAPMIAATVTAAELAKLKSSPLVASVELERRFKRHLDTSVPFINAPAAWTAGADGSGTAVVVIDTGVQRNHPMLTGKVVAEACFSSNVPFLSSTLCPNGSETQIGAGAGAPCPTSVAGCDHGTHVAGIAAGRNTQAEGPDFGVARGARIVAIQAASSSSVDCGSDPAPCTYFNPLDVADALGHTLNLVQGGAIAGGFRIAAVNMSIGVNFPGAGNCDLAAAPIKAQIDALRRAGVATVISAGNDGTRNSVGIPGCVSSAVTVGATQNEADRITGFSNMGAMVDVMAPGEFIDSALPGGLFGSKSGTSMAAPHVAGAFAAIRDAVPTATVDRIQSALAATGRTVRDTRTGGTFSRTRINVRAALDRVRATNPEQSVSPTTRQSFVKTSLTSFNPASRTFTITGRNTAFDFQITDVPVFLEVSPQSGRVPANGTFRITVRPSAAAFFLPRGSYNAAIRVTNKAAVGDVDFMLLRVAVP